MTRLTGVAQIEVLAEESKNLDTICYRGSAPLAHLAAISQADVFDQVSNPDGLQRDLSPKHAAEAYDYAYRDRDAEYPRAFPEVVLNVRDKSVVRIETLESDTGVKLHRLTFDRNAMRDDKVYVSRVDGNHRLFFADGDNRRAPLLVDAPFQLHVGLTREQERSLFVDINANQKGLNSSHLAVLRSKLTPEEQEIRDHLERWMAKRLAEGDAQSPWHGLIHLGGSKKGARAQGLTRPVNFASLEGGVKRTITKSQYIHDLTDPEAQYVLVRNYWQAVKEVFREEWARPKDYLLLRNLGVTSMSILGGTIIDRCVPRGTVSVSDMAVYLEQARARFDWGKDASGERSVTGMSGNRAALIIAGEMAEELSDPGSSNLMRDLQERLVGTENVTGGNPDA
jgi:DGQHR domain-containing protein